MLYVEYLSAAAADRRLADTSSRLLGVVGFPNVPTRPNPVPSSPVGLAGDASTICEVWAGSSPTRYGSVEGVRFAISGELLFGVISSAESQGPLEVRARDAYAKAFAAMEQLEHPHALRFWNYLPRINAEEHGLERYRAFNSGRHAAFEAAGRLRPESIPAACALGTRDELLSVHFVAARSPGRPIENPRQVNAWRYPEQYGPKSPTFARACVFPAQAPEMLFVSGTASIVGHLTLHAGDVIAQTRETLRNLEAVFAEAGRHAPFSMHGAQYKAYVRHAADVGAVRRELLAALGEGADVAVLRADICRSDLLVEVEAFCRSEAA